MDTKRINVTISGDLLEALEMYKRENFVVNSTTVIVLALKEFLAEQLDYLQNKK